MLIASAIRPARTDTANDDVGGPQSAAGDGSQVRVDGNLCRDSRTGE